jgi:Per os infectivity factor 3
MISLVKENTHKLKKEINSKFKFRDFTEDKSNCSETKVHCFTNSDCTENCIANSNEKYKCFKNVCLNVPKPNQIKCSKSTGGVLVFTGNDELGLAKFECLCMFPELYTGISCDKLQKHVCNGGHLNVVQLESLGPYEICTCALNKIKIGIRQSASARFSPICVGVDERFALENSGVSEYLMF